MEFDRDSFTQWFRLKAKHPKKDCELYAIDCKRIFLMCHRDGKPQRYKLSSDMTRSGSAEFYVNLAKPKEPTELTEHKEGYDHFIHSQADGFVYFDSSMAALIYGIRLIKEYKSYGWNDDIQLIRQGVIKGNVVDISGNYK